MSLAILSAGGGAGGTADAVPLSAVRLTSFYVDLTTAGAARGPARIATGRRTGVSVAALALLAVAIGSLADSRPPDAQPADAPADRFSAWRARRHVAALAAAPRPVGSRGHAEARRYLVARLAELGLEPSVQDAPVTGAGPRGPTAARVRNVIARLPGRRARPALLLMAHYDSVPFSPGAADDASGVAALLEAARALAAGPPPPQDVVFLFTDAEEIGLLGATAFAGRPETRDVGLVVNFEARGSSGPSILFELLSGSEGILPRLARELPDLLTTSLAGEAYRRMPNDTDLSAFRDLGLRGLNFAFIGSPEAYHRPADRMERLDLASLQHHGGQAVAIARGMRIDDLAAAGSGEPEVYFTAPGFGLLRYPAAASAPWALAVAAVAAGLAAVAVARRRAAAAAIAAGAAAAAIAPLVAMLAAQLIAPAGAAAGPSLFLAAAALGAGAGLAAVVLAGRFSGRRDVDRHTGLATGVAVAWAAMALPIAFAAPGAAYLLLVPALFLVAGAAAALAVRRRGAWRAVALVAAPLPAVALWTPISSLLGQAFPSAAAALVAACAAIVAVPAAAPLVAPGRWIAWPAAALSVLGGVALAAADAPPSPPSPMIYAVDGVDGSAGWFDLGRPAPAGPTTTPSPARYLLDGHGAWSAEAAPAALPPPRIVPEPGPANDDGRRLRFRVHSARGAPQMRLALRSSTAIRRVAVDGRSLLPSGSDPGLWRTELYGGGEAGFALEVELDGPAPLAVTLVDLTYRPPRGTRPAADRPVLTVVRNELRL